ncbi:hypothetical protein D3C85_717650 [compost metagenome]
MFNKGIEVFGSAAGNVCTTNSGCGERTFQTIGSIIIKFKKLSLCPFPIGTIRFIPNFPIPAFYFGFAVAGYTVFYPFVNQVAPFLVIFGWVGPSGFDYTVFCSGFPLVLVGNRMGREGLGHKTNLRQWFHSAFNIRIENLVNNFPVIYGVALGIFGVGIG